MFLLFEMKIICPSSELRERRVERLMDNGIKDGRKERPRLGETERRWDKRLKSGETKQRTSGRHEGRSSE